MQAPSDSRPPCTGRPSPVWRRNVDRVLAYIERLDRASNRKGLMAAVDRLSRDRSALARDGQRVNEGLVRLGADNCDIDPPVVTKTINLPAAPTPRPMQAGAAQRTPRATATPGTRGVGLGVRAVHRPRVNTPAPQRHAEPAVRPVEPAEVNTPVPDGPTTGGGGADG